MPLGESDQFKGVIDLVDMSEQIWSDKLGNIIEKNPLREDHPLYK